VLVPLCNQRRMTDMRINTLIVALFALIGLGGAVEKANAQIVLSVGIAPPALPVYVQPAIPAPGYIWTPGYWAWNAEISEYYWVPGAWALPPRVGLLWTPGYWGWSGGEYVWNAGYWGPTVGFYGGVCYGFGYTGVGFAGGYWSGGSFYYNRSVTNISNTTVINNVYNQQVVNNHTTNVSYNGGNGGLRAQPTQRELQAANEQHIAPTHEQQNHQQLASQNKDLRASVNHGAPTIAAVGKAGDFSSHNAVAAQAAGAHVKPASLTTGGVQNGAHPGGQNSAHPGGNNQTGVGNATTGKTHAGPNVASQSNGAAGAAHRDASHGANNNAVANLNAGANGQHKNLGSNAGHPNGASPQGAMMMKMPGNPAAHAQPHPNMPRPAAHMPPPGGPRPGAQPHPAAQQKKDQHHS
jgi:WXXGXW repeat (2 copies)